MELPSPPEHEDLVWFFIIARNDAAKEALSLTKRQYKDRVGLEVLDEGHPDTEQGLGWLAIPRNGWQSAGFRQNPYNVVTFGHGGSQCDMVLPRRAKCTGTPPLQARIFVRHEDGNSVLMFRDESCCQSSFMFRRDASEELYKFTQDDVGRQRFIKEKGTTYISVGGAHFTLSFEELSDSAPWWRTHMSSKESVISGAEKPSWSFALGRRHPPKNNGPTPCKQHEQARIEVCDEWDRWIKVKRNRVTRGPTDQLPGETDEYVFKLMHAGDGASGKVSLVMNARTGRMMARKVIKLDDSVQNRAIAKRESDNLECLEKLGDRSHDLNIVRFYHFFPIESAFHIYMTPAHGSLRDSLLEQHEENDVMSITGVQDLARQMLNALIYLHEVEGIIHRDIKPDNILVLHPSDNSRPITYLLADFGLTTRAEYIARTKCGTSKYVAPEIASLDELHRLRKLEDGRGQTGAVDIWSLGVTLLETRLRGDLCGPRSWENWDLKLWCQFLEWQTRSSPLTPLLTYDVKKRASARLLYKTLKLDRAQFESMNANCDLETFERYIAQSTGLPYDENKALQRKQHQDNLKSMSCDSYHGSTPSSGSKKRGLDGFVQDFQMKKSRTSSKLSPPPASKPRTVSKLSSSALASDMSISSAATLVGEENETKEENQMAFSYGGTGY